MTEEEDEEILKAMEEDEAKRAVAKDEMTAALAAKPVPPPDFSSGGGEIVPAGESPYEIMDRKDEEQILADLNGVPDRVLEEMVYSFSGSMGKVTGLSWVGVRTLSLEAGHIGIVDVKVQDTPDSFRVLAMAKDYTHNVTFFGIAEQPKMMETRNGAIPDKFALAKAMSKAQRNALMNMLPRTLVAEFIKRCMAARGPKVRYA